MDIEPKHLYFSSRKFFHPEFPFSIYRMNHTPSEYNEAIRCQREFWKIIYIIAGHGTKIINNSKYPMSPGSLFIIHPEDETTFQIESDYIDIYNVLFMPELISDGLKRLKSHFGFFEIFGNDFQSSPDRRKMLYALNSSKEIEQLIKKIEKEYKQEASNYRNMISLYLQALLINISRLSSRKASKGKKAMAAQYITHIIETHYHEVFDYDYLSREIGMNKTYMSRLYSKTTGKTITEALLEHRLERSKKLLQSSSKNITEICYGCGFNDLSYFYRAFRNSTGMNPGQYRKKFGLQ